MKKTNVFTAKPFVLSDPASGQVYCPKRTVTVSKSNKKSRVCVCVHVCDQFLTYPVTKWGIRIIPENTKCKFGGTCLGNRLLRNGEPINRSVDLSYRLFKDLPNSGR